MRSIFYNILFVILVSGVFAQDYWMRTGGPEGGEVSKFIELSDGSILAATGFSGIFKSIDDGNSWTPANVGSSISFMTDIAMAPNGDVYAVGINTITGVYLLIHSSDNGLSWTEITAPPIVIPNNYLFDITKLAIAPNGDIYVAGRILLGFYTSGGLYKSTDGGANWIPVLNTGANGYSITDVEVSDSGAIFYSTNKSIYKSTDAAENFTEVYNDRRIDQLYIKGDSNIYARETSGRIFHSSDTGENWNEILKTEGENLISLFVDDDGDIFTMGTAAKLFHSDDDGANWNIITDQLPDLRGSSSSRDGACFFSTSKGKHLFGYLAGTAKTGVTTNLPDILVSNGDLETWDKSTTGFTAASVGRLFENSTGAIFASAHGNVLRSNDQGNSWDFTNIDYTLDVSAFLESKTNNNIFISGFGFILRSDDLGSSWTNVTHESMVWTIADMVSNANGDIYAIQHGATAAGVYKSVNNGDSWDQIKADIIPYALEINQNGDIFVGLRDSDILRSTDNGASWESVKNGLPAGFVVHNLLSTADGKLIAVLQASGFFISEDNGDNWEEMNTGIQRGSVGYGNIDVRSLDNNSHGDVLAVVKYLSTEDNPEQSIMCLKSGTTSWEELSKSGMNEGDLVNYILITSDDAAYIGTTSSVYKTQSPTTAISEKSGITQPFNLYLADNYPNPFNPSTTIRYNLNVSGPVTLKVYDMRGAEVAELVNSIQTTGSYQIVFNANGLASGQYFYRLKTNSGELFKRMLLVK